MKYIYVCSWVSDPREKYSRNGKTYLSRDIDPCGWSDNYHDCILELEKSIKSIKGEGYTYVVIEKKEQGINRIQRASSWFKINYHDNKLDAVEKPTDLSRVVGFTI